MVKYQNLHVNTRTKIYGERRTTGGTLGAPIPTVIRTLQPALPKGLEGFHGKAHPEPKKTNRAQVRIYQSRIQYLRVCMQS